MTQFKRTATIFGLLLVACGIILACACKFASAQNVEGQIIAAQFGEFQVPGQSTGNFTFPPDTCQVSGGGKNFSAFATGTPVKIVDPNPAHTEIATPSSVFINTCVVNMATTFTHVPPFYLTSGTGGLQEALTNGIQRQGGPNTIILNAEWYTLIQPRSASTVIGSVTGSATLPLVDVTTAPYTWYSWNGSAYAVDPIGGVTSFNTRTGAVVPATGDYAVSQVTGAAPLASPALTGTPTVPTASVGTNTTQAASTAFVIANAGSGGVGSGTKGQQPYYAANGSTLTAVSAGLIVPPSGDTTGATDGTNISSACTSNHSVQLTAGTYYIGHSNSTITLSTDCRIIGVGLPTVIQNEGTTNDWFKFNNFTLWNESPWEYPTSTQQNELAWMQFKQDPDVTPTAGHLVVIGSGVAQSGGTFSYTFNVHVHDTVANNVFAGASIVTDELYASLDHNVWNNFVSSSSGNCINYNAEVGSGDNYFGPEQVCSGAAADYGILIAQSDVQHFISSKLNGSGVQFSGAGATKSVIFNDMSIETGVTKPCMMDFGTGSAPVNIQFINSEQYGFTQAFCHPTNVSGFAFAFNNSLITSDYQAGLITNNGYTNVALTYQDFASFAGTVNTALSSYTTAAPGSGKTFVQYTADGVTPLIMPVLSGSSSEQIASGHSSDFGDVLDTLTPATANYTVSEIFTLSSSSDQVALFARASSGANTNYVFGYSGAGNLFLYSQVAGTAVLLANPSFTWGSGVTHTLSLTVNGTTITASVDGSAISGTPLTNSAVTATGQAGSRIFGGATGTNFFVQ